MAAPSTACRSLWAVLVGRLLISSLIWLVDDADLQAWLDGFEALTESFEAFFVGGLLGRDGETGDFSGTVQDALELGQGHDEAVVFEGSGAEEDTDDLEFLGAVEADFVAHSFAGSFGQVAADDDFLAVAFGEIAAVRLDA